VEPALGLQRRRAQLHRPAPRRADPALSRLPQDPGKALDKANRTVDQEFKAKFGAKFVARASST
jgi:hypothetical protein